MHDRKLRVAVLLTICLTATYVCGAWLTVKEWNLDILDGSWEYGLRQMHAQGMYLGKDVPLTYGPLAHSLSPVIRDGQRPFALFYVLGALYACFGLFALWCLLGRIEKAGWFTYAALTAFVCSLPLAGFSTIRGELDTGIFFWIIVTWLALFLQSDSLSRYLCMAGLCVLTVTGMQIKFSFGVFGTAVFLVSLLSIGTTIGIRAALVILVAFSAANWLVFFALTGSWSFHEYFIHGLSLSSLYADANALHRPHDASDSRYVLAILGCVNFVFVVGVAAYRLTEDRTARLSMLALALVSSFFLFKMGFVRADQHTLMFYQTLFPILLLLYAIVLPHLSAARLTVVALCVGLVVSLAGYHYELRVFGSGFVQQLCQTARSWAETPIRIVDAMLLQSRGFTGEGARVLALEEGFPHLTRYLRQLDAQPTEKPRSIAFAPWETMLYHFTRSFSLSPLPTLQIYPELLVRDAPVRVGRYLDSNQSPGVIVLGRGSIDSRNSLSEFTNWLPLLYRNYRPIHSVDGFTVLGRSISGNANRTIVCRKEGPGLFLKGRIQPLASRYALISRLLATLFKGPELVSVIDFVDGNGKPRRIACRSYRFQLEAGVYFSDMPIGQLLQTMNRQGPALPETVISAVSGARLVRLQAARNFPVCPEEVPIELEFCSPEGFRFER
jgi:hypothetical protein